MVLYQTFNLRDQGSSPCGPTTMHTKDLGTYGEAIILAEVLKYGCAAFPEFGDNSKIDLIISDATDNLHRIQIKSMNRSKRAPNSSILYLYKTGPNYYVKYTQKMIDWFALIDLQSMQLGWISSEEAFKNTSAITFYHGANKDRKVGRNFEDYRKFPFIGKI